MIKFILAVIFLISPLAHADNELSLRIGTVTAQQWQVQGLTITANLAEKPGQLILTIKQLNLPKPFSDLNSINLTCSDFIWQDNGLLCRHGQTGIHSGRERLAAHISFFAGTKRLWFKSTDLRLAGGTIAITAEKIAGQWQTRMIGTGIKAGLIEKWLQSPLFEPKEGTINFVLKAAGHDQQLEKLSLTTDLKQGTGQSEDGRLATEKLTLHSRLDAHLTNNLWQWQSHVELNGGAVYLEPVYLDANGENIALDAQGNWHAGNRKLQITSAQFIHAQTIALNGNAMLRYAKGIKVDQAELSVHSENLQKLSSIYLQPFLEQTAGGGLSLAGELQANFSISQQSLTALSASFNHLTVNDTKNRLQLQDGAGTVHWSDHEMVEPSRFAWQRIQVYALPVEAASLSFLGNAHGFKLLEKARLPFLGGAITIQQMGWQARQADSHDVYFEGELNDVSLKQLSKALNWKPLSGNINGSIPRIEYSNDTLSLDGELIIKVFDGEIRIANIASSGLFSDFPRVYSELEIDRLDLGQLTGQFDFGGMTGKLSGFIRQLTLENWKPVSFYAWFGTPDDDDSTHKISQKAVKNITRLGGGGVSDLVSRTFLNLFETFSYSKFGFGCYLHKGVCQLMGLDATASGGYTIIKGGGLPRIDVIGYNPQLDWQILMERLSRIATTDEVIIQ